MKKALFFLITTFSVVVSANEYSFLEEKNEGFNRPVMEEYSLGISDEYQSYNYEDMSQADIMSEYEEHVVDTIKPSIPSKPVAFLTHLGCVALINYIALQEKAKIYFAEIKHALNNWFNFITTLY